MGREVPGHEGGRNGESQGDGVSAAEVGSAPGMKGEEATQLWECT